MLFEEMPVEGKNRVDLLSVVADLMHMRLANPWLRLPGLTLDDVGVSVSHCPPTTIIIKLSTSLLPITTPRTFLAMRN